MSMSFVRKIANSEILTNIFDIPDNLRNKKVEILVFPYEDLTEDNKVHKTNKARGLLADYKNKELRMQEEDAWSKAVLDGHENS